MIHWENKIPTIPWTEEPGRLHSTGSQRVGMLSLSLHIYPDVFRCIFHQTQLTNTVASCFPKSVSIYKTNSHGGYAKDLCGPWHLLSPFSVLTALFCLASFALCHQLANQLWTFGTVWCFSRVVLNRTFKS